MTEALVGVVSGLVFAIGAWLEYRAQKERDGLEVRLAVLEEQVRALRSDLGAP